MPCNTPTTEPMGLNACEKFNLCSKLPEGPSKVMKGLAPVSRNANPDAITKRDIRKNPISVLIYPSRTTCIASSAHSQNLCG